MLVTNGMAHDCLWKGMNSSRTPPKRYGSSAVGIINELVRYLFFNLLSHQSLARPLPIERACREDIICLISTLAAVQKEGFLKEFL